MARNFSREIVPVRRANRAFESRSIQLVFLRKKMNEKSKSLSPTVPSAIHRLHPHRDGARRGALKKKLLFFFGLLVILLFLLRFLDLHPLSLPFLNEEDAEQRGSPAWRERKGDILIIHGDAEKQSRPFSSTDWSLAWVNTIEQEVGPLSLRKSLPSPEEMKSFRAIILTPGGMEAISKEECHALESFVQEGGILFLDRPPLPLSSLSGLTLGEALRNGKRITGVADGFLESPFREILIRLPLHTTLFPPSSLTEDVKTLLWIDNAPALFSREISSGLVVTLAFNLPLALTSLQQGVPAGDGFQVEKKLGSYDFIIEPEDLLLDPCLLDNRWPFADILERAILSPAIFSGPLPRWWYFQYGKEGAFIMTHDEDMAGPKESLPMARYEKQEGFTSTFFLISHPRFKEEWGDSANPLERAFELGSDMELHWNRFPMPFGLWKIEPFQRVFSLAYQKGLLDSFLGEGRGAIANRTHYLVCGDHYTRTFRILEKAGIQIDTSFGPNKGGRGYLFGTGLPFHPLDTDGSLFSLLELPFVTQEDWGGVDRDFFAALLSESREHFHQTIVPIFHPHLIVKQKDGEALWKSTYELAEENRHWITNLREFLHFYKKRILSPLRSSREGNRLTLSLEALASGMAVVVPRELEGAELSSAKLDGQEAGGIQHSFLGAEEISFPIPLGPHLLEIFYSGKE